MRTTTPISLISVLFLLLWGCSTVDLQSDSSSDRGTDSDIDTGLDLLDYGGKNTIFVPMDVGGTATWKEFAFLAAVPAGAKINQSGKPSVIALNSDGDITEYFGENYLGRYNPDYIYSIGSTNGWDGVTPLPSSSLDDVTCELARFFGKSDDVVVAFGSDYQMALVASGLAGRLPAPLFFFEKDALSADVLKCIDTLGADRAVLMGGNQSVTDQLEGIGVDVEQISSPKYAIEWLVGEGLDVEYFAVCNPNDRELEDYAPKTSLAAPLLASGRNGVVVPLFYETDFNHAFVFSSTTNSMPPGAATSADGVYRLGSFTLNNATHNFVITESGNAGDFADTVNIDWNNNGYFGDSGELLGRGDMVTINGKRYSLTVNDPMPFSYGNLKFYYPTYTEMNEDFEEYYNQLGHYPKYMALVGMPQVLAPGIVHVGMDADVDCHTTGQVFADVDDDDFFDIAIGRIVGEDVSIATLFAARSLTYDDLIDPFWADNMCSAGTFIERTTAALHQYGNLSGFNADHWEEIPEDEQDPDMYSIFVQDDHGWPFGIEPSTFSLIAPSITEGGGCNQGSLDENWYTGSWCDWKEMNAVVLARQGAICLNAYLRGTPASKDIGRHNFHNALLYHGATLGEARLYQLNTLVLNDSAPYIIMGNVMYGDPALKPYIPPGDPIYKPAYLEVNGSTITAHGPEERWVDYLDIWDHPYIYSAPGQTSSWYDYTLEDPAITFVATHTTTSTIDNMTQESGIPSPLGWKNGTYMIDEHWDGSRTIYWQVRFDDFDYESGTFSEILDNITYTID